MNDTFLDAAQPAESPRLTALRSKIRIICHVIRLVTLGYVLFVAWGLYDHWADRAKVERGFAAFYKLDISGASATQYALAASVSLLVWATLAILCFFVWRLFGCYLRGDIAVLFKRKFENYEGSPFHCIRTARIQTRNYVYRFFNRFCN